MPTSSQKVSCVCDPWRLALVQKTNPISDTSTTLTRVNEKRDSAKKSTAEKSITQRILAISLWRIETTVAKSDVFYRLLNQLFPSSVTTMTPNTKIVRVAKEIRPPECVRNATNCRLPRVAKLESTRKYLNRCLPWMKRRTDTSAVQRAISGRVISVGC